MEYSEKPLDIIIIAGQSNAQGYGLGEVGHPFRENERILMLRDRNASEIHFDENGFLRIGQTDPQISVAKECEQNGAKIGNFALPFADEYVKSGLLKDDRSLLIVYAAVGGTGFAKCQWGETAILQERMLRMVDHGLGLNPENKVVAFLWHQGEHDAFENSDLSDKTREAFYYEKFWHLIRKVREKYGDGIPVVAGGFATEWRTSGYEAQCDAVSRATKKALKENGGAFAETKDLLSNNQLLHNGDNIHFCRQSLYTLGKRYFKAYCKILQKGKMQSSK